MDQMIEISPIQSVIYICVYVLSLAFIISNFFRIYVINEYKRLAKIRKMSLAQRNIKN